MCDGVGWGGCVMGKQILTIGGSMRVFILRFVGNASNRLVMY